MSGSVAEAGLRTLRTTRHVTPFREDGSMPALVEADDQMLYVLNLQALARGRSRWWRSWLAERLLRVPDLPLMEVNRQLGRNEPDAEIRDLLASDHFARQLWRK